jgi:hypothetical protein
MAADFLLAQVNIARAQAPIDSALMADFVAALDRINALADAAPGFVWRLQTEDGDATAIRPFDDAAMLINMSLWRSVETLREFVYRSGHVEVMRRRREWFERIESHMALWWLPDGELPSIADAKQRLAHLAEHGPTPYAFTFKRRFEPGAAHVVIDDAVACPA